MGGLANHISHVYEDLDFRFHDIKELFRKIGRGEIDVYEKYDGQNLFITWDFFEEKLKVARNKKNIKEGGLDRYGLSLKFGDRPDIENLFVGAYDAINEAMNGISENEKSEIFGSMGGIWFSIEIINPELPNTILYDKKRIIFHKHGPVYFGYDAEPIETSLERNLEMLESCIPRMNEESTWEISGPNCLNYDIMGEEEISDFCKEIDKIYPNEQMSIRIFLFKKIRGDMDRFHLIPKDIRIEIARTLTKHPRSKTLNQITKTVDKFVKDQIDQLVKIEKEKLDTLLGPIEEVVHRFSFKFLDNLDSEFIKDVEYESDRISAEFNRCSNILQDDNRHEWLGSMTSKMNSDKVTIEGVVFEYRGNLYKFTGNFAPMNRVIADIKYSDLEKKKNVSRSSLATFITV